jgi:hypothetical protein
MNKQPHQVRGAPVIEYLERVSGFFLSKKCFLDVSFEKIVLAGEQSYVMIFKIFSP